MGEPNKEQPNNIEGFIILNDKGDRYLDSSGMWHPVDKDYGFDDAWVFTPDKLARVKLDAQQENWLTKPSKLLPATWSRGEDTQVKDDVAKDFNKYLEEHKESY